jgi:hypothetical protein
MPAEKVTLQLRDEAEKVALHLDYGTYGMLVKLGGAKSEIESLASHRL